MIRSFIAFGIFIGLVSGAHAAAPPRPNIVLIMSDDMGSRIWVAMEAKFKRQISMHWLPEGYGSPSSITWHAAVRLEPPY
jgi:hypothetical protein